jgi:hypothetical protein
VSVRNRLLVAGVVVTSFSGFGPLPMAHGVTPPPGNDIVTSSDAAMAATNFLGTLSGLSQFKGLASASVGTPRLALDTNDQPGGFEVPLYAGATVAGYVVTSASRSQAPILRVAHGDLDVMTAETIERVRTRTGHQVVSSSPIFVDAFSEGIRATLDDGTAVDAALNGDPSVGAISGRQPAPSSGQAQANQLSWARMAGPAALTPAATAYYVDYGEGWAVMPAFTWTDGCTPTAAEMVEAYWSKVTGGSDALFPQNWYWVNAQLEDSTMGNAPYWIDQNGTLQSGRITSGFPPVRGNDPSVDSMVRKLSTDMSTDLSTGLTFLTKVAPGIRSYERAAGVNRPVSTVTNPSLADFESQIDGPYTAGPGGVETHAGGVPGTATFISWLFHAANPANNYDGYAPQTINHSVAVKGYLSEQGATYMIAFDDYRPDGETLIVWDGNWSQSQLDYPHP